MMVINLADCFYRFLATSLIAFFCLPYKSLLLSEPLVLSDVVQHKKTLGESYHVTS